MPLYNRLIEKVNEEEEKPLGTADPLKIRPKAEAAGKWITDQYKRLPSDVRTGIEQGIQIGSYSSSHFADGSPKPFTTGDILSTAYKPIESVKDELSRATGLDPINFDAAELGIDIATLSPAAIRKFKILNKVFPTNPLKTTEILRYTGAGLGDVKKVNPWKQFGYTDNQVPTQLQKVADNPQITPLQVAKVDQDLFNFYSKAQKWEASGQNIGRYPKYWVNPATNDTYKISKVGNRYTLISKNRYIRSLQKSSIIQKSAYKGINVNIKNLNKKLVKEFNEKRNELTDRLNFLDEIVNRSGSGKPGSVKTGNVQSVLAARREVQIQLDELLDSIPYSRDKIPTNFKGTLYYGEHGYGLANERIQKIAKSFNNFSLGDAKNFHPTLIRGETKNFKTIKDRLEKIINATNRQGEYLYGGITVNYNPNLHNGQEYILRIEDINSIRMGGSQGQYPGILYGDTVLEIDILNPPPGLDLNSTRSIKEFFKKYKTKGDIQDPRKFIPSDNLKEPITETQRRIMEFILPDD
tara:strand:+ start:55 stop:1626 length:1572 start_codon:yes stop_codon:yes gene_type:complete